MGSSGCTSYREDSISAEEAARLLTEAFRNGSRRTVNVVWRLDYARHTTKVVETRLGAFLKALSSIGANVEEVA